MDYSLPKFTDEDFEITYSRKRKHSVSSTESSASSSPSYCSTSSSNSSGSPKNLLPATPSLQEDYLQKKRTLPVKFVPKQKAPTSRFQPQNVKENKATEVPHVTRPLQHIVRRPLINSESNQNMKAYREYRQMEMEKAQAAKVNGTREEPPKKKRAQRTRKEF